MLLAIWLLALTLFTWYPFQSELWVETPWVGESIIGTKGDDSFNVLGEDQEGTDVCDTPCNEIDPPLPYPEGGLPPPPPTAVGSGWLNLQFAPNLQEPVRM